MAYTTVNKSTDYVNTKLYTGNGSTQSITGVGFQPDWLWIKERDGSSSSALQDAVRGNNKKLMSNSTDAESTETAYVTSFDSDGFSLGTNNGINQSGVTNVAWNWKANGAGSANTDGDINSTVSVNTTAGFSIVKYTGTDVAGNTVGHGLNAVPKLIIVKRLADNGYDWVVYHKDKTAGLYLNSDGNNNDSSSNNIWFNGTAPTSSVFSIGTDGRIGDAVDYIAYCFSQVDGFSSFGKYTGNGNTDGKFCYTGFKPAIVLCKRTNGTSNWGIFDNKRDPLNTVNKTLFPNSDTTQDSSTVRMDFLSNGFKHRTTDTAWNGSGDEYIWIAFAAEPIVGTNPATAY
jgi:hypothetical protein